MRKEEFVNIVDPDEANNILLNAELTQNQKSMLIRERWEHLYQEYRAPEEHIQGMRDYQRRRQW